MYFPFLTCEVKCGAAALDVADRQNAHSMTVAVRGIVKLFETVNRQKELHQEVLAFSISHDHTIVRIYGHYPIVEEESVTYYRHPIHEFSFKALDGREKWTAHKFVKNVYEHHSMKIHSLISSVVAELPDNIDFGLSQSVSFSRSGPQSSQRSPVGSLSGGDDSQSSIFTSQNVTPISSFAQAAESVSKKLRRL